MKTNIKYYTNDGYVELREDGNTYVGRCANDILTKVFIPNDIKGYENEKDILDHAVKEGKLRLECPNQFCENGKIHLGYGEYNLCTYCQ